MATKVFARHQLCNILMLLLLSQNVISKVNKSVNFFSHLTNPCYSRRNGLARDLSSCKQYFQCDNGEPSWGICDDGYVFNAETEMCVDEVHSAEACFRCDSQKQYELVSVPGACQQYIQCVHSIPSLRICPNGLVFDGRAGVHQCNMQPSMGGCHRENANDIEKRKCPPSANEPIYIIDPDNRSVYVFSLYVVSNELFIVDPNVDRLNE